MGRRRAVTALAVVALVSTCVLGSAGAASAARKVRYVGDAPGSVTCVLFAIVSFSPPLTESGGGTNPSMTKGKLTHCAASDAAVTIRRGNLTGSFAADLKPGCTHLASLTTPATFTVSWKGRVDGAVGTTTYGGGATFTTSTLTSLGQGVSNPGGGDLELVLPNVSHGAGVAGSFAGGAQSSSFTNFTTSSLAVACNSAATGGSGPGVKKLTLNGTITLGSSLATPVHGALVLTTDAQQSYCAVLSSGTVRCWGDGTTGELGDGTTATSSVAMAVTGITNAKSIVSDGGHSYCAVLASGAVKCWGDGGSGELGDGTTSASSVPVSVTGITNASAVISGGANSYCAVLQTAAVECWGSGAFGQLGDGATTNSSVPLAVTGITEAASVTSDGAGTYCAVLTTGAVDCWGDNGFGQLGDASTTNSSVPLAVTSITNAASVSSDGDDSYCAVLTSGAIECWGANFSGELGNGTTTTSTVPVAVTGITNASSISYAGGESYCAVLATGAVDCWGANNFGQLGNGATTSSSVPVTVSGITNASAVSSDGDDSYCAVLASGSADCWGANFSGDLGNGTTMNSTVPVAVTGITSATAIAGGIHSAANNEHSYCAILATGAIDCWGSNDFGELGDATMLTSSVPVSVIQP